MLASPHWVKSAHWEIELQDKATQKTIKLDKRSDLIGDRAELCPGTSYLSPVSMEADMVTVENKRSSSSPPTSVHKKSLTSFSQFLHSKVRWLFRAFAGMIANSH